MTSPRSLMTTDVPDPPPALLLSMMKTGVSGLVCLCLSSSCRDVGLLLGKLGVVGLAEVVVAVVVDGTRGGGVWFS